MDRNLEMKERRLRYQCKCHWTPDKVELSNQLHQLKISYN